MATIQEFEAEKQLAKQKFHSILHDKGLLAIPFGGKEVTKSEFSKYISEIKKRFNAKKLNFRTIADKLDKVQMEQDYGIVRRELGSDWFIASGYQWNKVEVFLIRSTDDSFNMQLIGGCAREKKPKVFYFV